MSLLVVDGDYYLNKSYFSNQKFINDENTGITFKFLVNVRYLIEYHGVSNLIIVFDGENSSGLRKTVSSLYKNDREDSEKKKILNHQKNIIRYFFHNLNTPVLTDDNMEGDDLISYIVKKEKGKKIIASNDFDLAQLIDENTDFYMDGKNQVFNHSNFEYLIGYKYENLALIKAITGCKSDNVIGVRGVGIKTLLDINPSIKTDVLTLDDFLLNLPEETKSKKILKIKETSKDYLIDNMKLVDLNENFFTKDFELPYSITKFAEVTKQNIENIINLFGEMEMNYMLRGSHEEKFSNFLKPFLNLKTVNQ